MRIRKILQWITRFLLLVILIIAAIVYLATTGLVQTRIASYFLKDYNEKIHGNLDFGNVLVKFPGRVTVNDFLLTSEHGDTILSVDKIYVSADAWAIRRHVIHIHNCELSGVRAFVAVDSAGNSNIQQALAPVNPKPDTAAIDTVKPFDWRIHLDRFALEGERTELDMDTMRVLELDEWTLKADGSYDGSDAVYRMRVVSENLFDIESSGSLLQSGGMMDIHARVNATVDSVFAARYPDPAGHVGTVSIEADGAFKQDSLIAQFDLKSSTAGSVKGNVNGMYIDSIFSGSGELAFLELNPMAVTGDTMETQLTGTLGFEKRRTNDWVNGWTALLVLDSGRYDRYNFSASLHASTQDSAADITGQIMSGSAFIDLTAHAEGFDPETMSAAADAEFQNVVLQEFIDGVPDTLGALNGHLTADFASVSPDDLSGTVHVDLQGPQYGSIAADSIYLSAAVKSDTIIVDTLLVTAGDIEFDARATAVLHQSVEFNASGSIPDLKSLSAYSAFMNADSLPWDSIAGRLDFDASGSVSLVGDSVSGLILRGNAMLKNAAMKLDSVRYVELNIAEFRMDTLYFDGSFRADSIFVVGQRIDSVVMRANGTPDRITTVFNLWMKADTINIAADLTTRIVDSTYYFTLDSLSANLYGAVWVSQNPAEIIVSKQRMDVEGLYIQSVYGSLRATGFLQKEGEQDFVVELSGLETTALASFSPVAVPDAMLNLRLQIIGTETALRGDIAFTADSVHYDGQAIADKIFIAASVDGDSAIVNGAVLWYGADTLAVVQGRIPARLNSKEGFVLLKNDSLSGRVRVLEQPLERLNPWMSPGTSLKGILKADIEIIGTPDQPDWSGNFSVREGAYDDKRTGVHYKYIVVDGELYGDSLIISQLRLSSEGTLTGSGTAIMKFPLPERLDLKLHFDEFEAIDSRDMKAEIDGDLTISGPFDALDARGTLRFRELMYRITKAASKSIEEIDLEAVLAEMRGDTLKEKGFMVSTLYKGMSHDLRLEIPGNCWIRGEGMNIELEGELQLSKSKNEEQPMAVGEIEVKRGTVEYLGRELRVEDGSIRFDGPVNNPTMDITATKLDPDGSKITIHLQGPAQRVEVALSGVGPNGEILTTEDVALRLLGFGGSSNTLGAAGAEAAVAAAASGQLTNVIGRKAGLDVFKYRAGQGGLEDLSSGSLEVGTYVTDRLFVRVLQPVETMQSGQEVSIEYQLLRWLKMQAAQEGRENSEFNLLLQFEWH